MIKSFRHKGLEAFFLAGTRKGIQPHHAAKLQVQLATLDNATGPEDMHSGAMAEPACSDICRVVSLRILNLRVWPQARPWPLLRTGNRRRFGQRKPAGRPYDLRQFAA